MPNSTSTPNNSLAMKPSSILRYTFAGVLLAGLSASIPALRADDNGGGCPFCCDGKKKDASPSPTPVPSPVPTTTNAPTK
jgi:hypothetical protein